MHMDLRSRRNHGSWTGAGDAVGLVPHQVKQDSPHRFRSQTQDDSPSPLRDRARDKPFQLWEADQTGPRLNPLGPIGPSRAAERPPAIDTSTCPSRNQSCPSGAGDVSGSPPHVPDGSQSSEQCDTLEQQRLVHALQVCAVRGDVGSMREAIKYLPADIAARDRMLASVLLFSATSNAHAEVVRVLVEEYGAGTVLTDGNQCTALHHSAGRGNVDMTRLLACREGTDVEATNKQGCGPLSLAAKGGHVEVCRLLVKEAGADVNALDNAMITPLMRACEAGNVELVDALLALEDEEGRILVEVDKKGPRGETALHMSSGLGLVSVARSLVLAGASVEAEDIEGYTPIHHAVHHGYMPIVSLLMKVIGSDMPESLGNRLMEFAVERGQHEAARFLHRKIQEGEEGGDRLRATAPAWVSKGAVSQVAHDGRMQQLECLMDLRGVRPELMTGKAGASLLHYAAGGNRLETVQALVEDRRMDPDLIDKSNRTALHWASDRGATMVIEYLLSLPHLNSQATAKQNMTPFHRAVQKGHLLAVMALAQDPMLNVEAKTSQGRTALMVAAKRGITAIVRYLIEALGANVHAVDDQRRHALHHAALHGHLNVVRYLVEETDVVIDAVDFESCTASELASRNSFPEIHELLQLAAEGKVKRRGSMAYVGRTAAVHDTAGAVRNEPFVLNNSPRFGPTVDSTSPSVHRYDRRNFTPSPPRRPSPAKDRFERGSPGPRGDGYYANRPDMRFMERQQTGRRDMRQWYQV